MKPPFDIAGDFDTPVSAFAKLAPFEPRFLLESVEGGERIGRYSFIGFGDVLQVRLDEHSFVLGDERRAVPRSPADLLHRLRAALGRLPLAMPALGQVPLAGGLVGFTSYDTVRFFERLPQRLPVLPGVPLLHYLASLFSGRHALDPFQVYRALRLINPSPYMYFCRLGDLTVVGSSPEALVKLNRGQAELRPIAGTRPRSDDPAQDAQL